MIEIKIEITDGRHKFSLSAFIAQISHHEKANFLGDADCFFFQAMNNNHLFIATENNKIIALSAIDPLWPDLIETRTCFVLPAYRGLGLQRVMHEVRAVNIRQRWGNKCLAVSAVKHSTRATRENLLTLGFKLWDTPDKRVFGPCIHCHVFSASREKNCYCDFFYADENVLASLSERLLKQPVKLVISSKSIAAIIDCSYFHNHFDSSK
ncbi:hypothetical protein CS369_01830 [Candidatus Symbiopectobacterium sp. 'North America']|uniref:GNAT family N-acetyltransferase n=1 Tax=Candidatus Symbiopectobacterium sp. 'North America' TaxID=2794574 RepID=UPI0018CA8498|nr:GNAT family N-acetyltransferase [Candidatus Symbiopectobacterium sp. 'North America']MBG6243896.1 hypothetical protein [Candidatus Symbiopectobacterium sp. 'North America']